MSERARRRGRRRDFGQNRGMKPLLRLLVVSPLLLASACSVPEIVSKPFRKEPVRTDFITLEPVRWVPMAADGIQREATGWVPAAAGDTRTWMMRIGTRQYEEMVGAAKGTEVRSRLTAYAAREVYERRLCAGGKVSLRTPPLLAESGGETSFVVECGSPP